MTQGDFQEEEINMYVKQSNKIFDQTHILFPTMQKEGWERNVVVVESYSVIEPCSPSNPLLLYVWLTFNCIISQNMEYYNGI